jgi:predicted dehydrogenase
MVRVGLIGLGKMGISHCSIVNAQPDVELIAVCDASGFLLSAFHKYTKFECYQDYKEMLERSYLDSIVIATPTKLHGEMVRGALKRNLHVFVEKPFCLSLVEGKELARLAEQKGLVNQVGYHNRFIGTFQETKHLVEMGAIGEPFYFRGESYGPVVLKAKGRTWRSKPSEGGGCLFDYAAHVVNLIEYIVGTPHSVSGTSLRKIYSKDVYDAVYSTLFFGSGAAGHLSVNWSDESYRKMSTQISVFGPAGKIIADALECKIYLRENNSKLGLEKGWNMRYITDTTKPVGFNLRGEEYSAQIEYFFSCIKEHKKDNVNSFTSALSTDTILQQLENDAK